MIRLICDNCESPIDVGDEMAGQKVKCPKCGDINVVPAAFGPKGSGPAAAKPDRAAEAGYPPAQGPEATVMRVRRAMFRAKPGRFMLLVLGVVGGFGAAIWGLTSASTGTGATAATIGGLVGLACLGVLSVWKLLTLGESLEITNKRTVERTGILSKNTSEVRHQDIRNIQVNQTFAQRLLNVGTIGISSAGQEDIEIVAHDIPDPGRLRQVIDLYRQM